MEIFSKVAHLSPQIALNSAGAVSFSFKNVMWSLFGIVFLVYVGASLALVYHWRNYGMRSVFISVMQIIYFSVSVVILFVAFGALAIS